MDPTVIHGMMVMPAIKRRSACLMCFSLKSRMVWIWMLASAGGIPMLSSKYEGISVGLAALKMMRKAIHSLHATEREHRTRYQKHDDPEAAPPAADELSGRLALRAGRCRALLLNSHDM